MLPYGIQKRIELGRALAMEPRLLLLDEPVAGMNVEETEDMARYILEIQSDLGVAMILVEHDMHMVMDIADRVMALDFGEAARHRPARRGPGRPAGHRGLPGRHRHEPDRPRPAATDPAADLTAHASRPAPPPRRVRRPERVALRKKDLGRWKEYYVGRLRRAGGQGRSAASQPSASSRATAWRSTRENRPAWLLADLAIQGIGAVAVGIYPTSPQAEVAYLLDHSEAKVLIAEDEEQLDKALAVRDAAARPGAHRRHRHPRGRPRSTTRWC